MKRPNHPASLDPAPFAAVAFCAAGAEKVASNELKKLGLAVEGTGFGRARFRADLEGLYRALIGSRVADRVLLEVGRFRAEDFGALREGTLALPWERLAPAGAGVRVAKVRSRGSRLASETGAQAVAHGAIAARICARRGIARLPETDGDAVVRVSLERDEASLLLDLSGEPLFKRGYRKNGGAAPLRETTAAVMLLLSGWRRKTPLYDPCCGSGTILAEALMYAWDMAPGLRRPFAIDGLPIADRAIGEKVRAEFRAKVNADRRIRIAGSDADPEAVRLAAANLAAVGEMAGSAVGPDAVPRPLEIAMENASSPFPADDGGPQEGLLVANPPYGRRLGDRAEARRTHAEMAALAKGFPGWGLAAICDDPDFEASVGARADLRREMRAGPDPSYFFRFSRLDAAVRGGDGRTRRGHVGRR